MTIAKELEERAWFLADPATRWVNRKPTTDQESCLIQDGQYKIMEEPSNNFPSFTVHECIYLMSDEARRFLNSEGWLDADLGFSASFMGETDWNDKKERKRYAGRAPSEPDPADCVCVHTCAEDPATSCSHSGTWHCHEDDGRGLYGPCPVHPDAPVIG